ncbi:MAG: EAL domain-containing protein [Acidiferrobacterales bacterium]
MSLRFKLFLPLVIFGIAVVGFMNVHWLPQVARFVETQHKVELSKQLGTVAEDLAPLLAAKKTSTAFRRLDKWVENQPEWLSVELVDATGKHLYAARAKEGHVKARFSYTLQRPLTNSSRATGKLILRVDASSTLGAISTMESDLWGGFVLVLLILTLMMAVALELGIRAPVKRLSEASARLARGDLRAPLPRAGGDELGILVKTFISMRDAIQRFQSDLSFQATHDATTGLVNRREFERRLSAVLNMARGDRSQHALIYMDLDQFKVINDTCGHTAGDEYLRQLSSFLHGELRKHDTLARLGGDEFGVMLEHCPEEHAIRIANELSRIIRDFRFLWEGKSFTLGVSVGVVFIDEHSESLSRVLSVADAACYAAKDAGRNRIHVYREDDSTLVRRHGEMQWVSRINEAVEQDRFHLFYQLIVPVGRERDEGVHFEFLLRMQDRGGKIIPPRSFLHAAERYNLMLGLDRWVTQTAFRWLAEHPEQLAKLGLCTINLSGHTLGDSDFMHFMVKQFNEGNVPPGKVCFEITETAAIGNLAKATRFMSVLKNLGCRFSLDDFGSGMSSFGYLKNLPVDYLKIDGVFVKEIADDPVDFAMVKSINEMGHVMGKRTVAEFVEKEAILLKLREIGVDYAQGYGIARPRPLVEMDKDYIRREFVLGRSGL